MRRKKLSYEFRQKLRDLTPHDSAEVKRFREFLKDQENMPVAAFRAKWGDYMMGLK